jgi:hypothetical protein
MGRLCADLGVSMWRYESSGGTRYPVRPGEVWRADHHMIACGDLEQGDGVRLIERFGRPPDLTYCDPPWNNGNCAAFRTKAGVPRKVFFTDFLNALLIVARTTRRDVFLEMGNVNAPHLINLAEQSGGQLIRRWSITYYRKHPCTLIQLRFHGQGDDAPDLTGMDDDDTPVAALQACARPGDVIMDPCTGRGLTAATAAYPDRTFIGLELSPWRMSCTLSKLAALGCNIDREGNL